MVNNSWQVLALVLIAAGKPELRGDLTEVYSIMRGIEKVDNQNRFPRMENVILEVIAIR